ncbi:MAG: hypothetical protein HQ541_16695, partial [Mariniphaga sp.]|nr:hypothetical protein [Mariniphaga sp.]
ALNIHNNADTYPTIWCKNDHSNGSNAVYGQTNSTDQPALFGKNTTGNSSYVNGIYGMVASTSHYGIGTNGKGYFGGGTAPFTSLSVKSGQKMLTSPLTPEIEIYFSGSSHLINGSAEIILDSDISVSIATNYPIKVIITPTEMCNGMAVIEKQFNGFVVMELNNGKSNASFDWLVIARKAVSAKDQNAEEMPSTIPQCKEPELEKIEDN